MRAVAPPHVDRGAVLPNGSPLLSPHAGVVSGIFRGLSQAADFIVSGRQLLVVLDDSADAQRWAQSFAALVANRLGIKVETFENCSAESLIERFNLALGSKNFANARETRLGAIINRLVLVPDARSLCSPSGLLLARLATHFPGAGIRLIVLVDREALERCEGLLDCFGHSLEIIDTNSHVEIGHEVPGPRPQAVNNSNSRVGSSRKVEVSRLSPWKRMLGWSSALASLALISALVIVLLNRDLTSYSKPRPQDAQRTLVPELVKSQSTGQGGRR